MKSRQPKAGSKVIIRRASLVLPTYEPLPPDKNPMFLERRVYQGSSGRIYPLPFYNRIAEHPVPRAWDAVTIENGLVRVTVLPELGGRIHIGEDLTNGYHFFYRQSAIKPALVGLAGPWISGGVEINWPQHHRPATFMPVDVALEDHADGSKTIWLGDHDPLERMKGMHGVCLHPGRSVIELKVRAYNRTPFVQTFLWWANVAVHVHEGYQSFFPPDVQWVADHARRAVSRFPRCAGRYYGIDYAARGRAGVPAGEVPRCFVPPHCRGGRRPDGLPRYSPDDLSWYANIPVPTSYMCLGSQEDFSGGYDHCRQAGLVQVADHHIAPGKKQWTWGNHEFGYAWDRNLTDGDGPYVELMLGVYTDNQPDFSFLQPGETKSWSVHWYPIRAIGPAQAANPEAAASLQRHGRRLQAGVAVTRRRRLRIQLFHRGRPWRSWRRDVAPDRPVVASLPLPSRAALKDMRLSVTDATDRTLLLSLAPPPGSKTPSPSPATEPPLPKDVATPDELYLTGLHLAQYRHATRDPVAYWREGIRRDPGDARCNQALGIWHLRRGEFAAAEARLRRSIARLTARNANPYDGESHYQLGLALRFQGRDDEACAAFAKAAWNQAWRAASHHALAEIAACRHDWGKALGHLDESLGLDAANLRARNLRVLVLRRLGRAGEAAAFVADTLRLDPLDWWARHLRGDRLACSTQTRLDLALDHARAGFLSAAVGVLHGARPEPMSGTAPLVQYYLAHFHEQLGQPARARAAARRAARTSPDYCFPARLEEQVILERALDRQPRDARAACFLGHLLFDRRRHREAIACWQRSVQLDPGNAVAWRNLGLARFNVEGDAPGARLAYERAFRADPSDARLLYERDQLWQRTGLSPHRRLRQLELHRELVTQRDDTTLELCGLLSQVGRPAAALALLASRRFQPWEGGEGRALGQFVRARLLLGQAALRAGEPDQALAHFTAALHPPENLGEARHLLASTGDIHYWLGEAHAAAGERAAAVRAWQAAARARGDFQEMGVRAWSEQTCFTALALARLGRRRAATRLLRALARHARRLENAPARIDYFATSLPAMLLFADNLAQRQKTTALFLQAQAEFGLGRRFRARRLLSRVLRRDPAHAGAADLRSVLCNRPSDSQVRTR
ncbi:MAG TPA: DUF5107 domain-containing protein [Lacunisphaera sp.]|nr:DUF5107 domain-containing protein [Lacunisphaera sp.]